MWIGGQLASASASRGVLRLFLELELCRKDGQNDFFSTLGILRLVFFVSSTTAAAIKAPPPTTPPQASPTDTLRDEFRFFLEDGGISFL